MEDGKQVTKFNEGIYLGQFKIPLKYLMNMMLKTGCYVCYSKSFGSRGKFYIMDKNKVIKQNKYFRLFATSNTVGLGDTTGLYHGTQQINQGQMDRWNIVTTLNYLTLERRWILF